MDDSCESPYISDFPVDDVTLAAVEHSMQGAYTLDGDGNHVLVGGDYSFHDLMNFLSGYDVENLSHLEGNIYEYVGGPVYGHRDVIQALIQEVRRLRALLPPSRPDLWEPET